MRKNLIAGLDIGTTKVCCMIAEQSENGLQVIGVGNVNSNGGMKNGLIANIRKVSETVKEAVELASENAGVKVKELNIGIAGEHIQSIHHTGYVSISGEGGEVVKEDLERLNEDVKKFNSSKDMQLLHIIPEQFLVDDKVVEDPLGMLGKRLSATHFIILASVQAVMNIEKAVNMAGYTVRSKILQPIASSVSVLDENEKDLGIILIDIGGGTTDVAVFQKKIFRYSGVVGIGGNRITDAIRETYSIVSDEAENIKVNMGYAHPKAIVKNERKIIPGVGANASVEVSTEFLTEIIYNVMGETFKFIDGKLRQGKIIGKAKAGIVLTGGGAMLRGVTDLAHEIFGVPAKLGIPQGILQDKKVEVDILRPEYATVLGLIQNIPGITSEQIGNVYSVKPKRKSSFGKVIDKLKEIFDEL